MVLGQKTEEIENYLESDSTGRIGSKEGEIYLDSVEVGRLYGKVREAVRSATDREFTENKEIISNLERYGGYVREYWQAKLKKDWAKAGLERALEGEDPAEVM